MEKYKGFVASRPLVIRPIDFAPYRAAPLPNFTKAEPGINLEGVKWDFNPQVVYSDDEVEEVDDQFTSQDLADITPVNINLFKLDSSSLEELEIANALIPELSVLSAPCSMSDRVLPRELKQHTWLNAFAVFSSITGWLDSSFEDKIKNEQSKNLHRYLFSMIQLLRSPPQNDFWEKIEALQRLIPVSLDQCGIKTRDFASLWDLHFDLTNIFSKNKTSNVTIITTDPTQAAENFYHLEEDVSGKNAFILEMDRTYGYSYPEAILPVDEKGCMNICGDLFEIKTAIVRLKTGEFIVLERTQDGQFFKHDGDGLTIDLATFVKSVKLADTLAVEKVK